LLRKNIEIFIQLLNMKF